jgi:para-aminobenzoate synthetase component I
VHFLQLPYPEDPEAFAAVLSQEADWIWLDSGRPHSTQGRFDLFCWGATACAQVNNQGQLLLNGKAKPFDAATEADLDAWVQAQLPIPAEKLAQLAAQLPSSLSLDDIPFIGGLMGHFCYSWLHHRFGLPTAHRYALPVMQLNRYPGAVVIDHAKSLAYWVGEIALDTVWATRLDEAWAAQQAETKAARTTSNRLEARTRAFSAEDSRPSYEMKVEQIREHIRAGRCYQVNLSQHFSASSEESGFALYRRLRQATPSPFSALVQQPGFSLLSVSPERFLQMNGQAVSTSPIKGSCPTGKSEAETIALGQALTRSEKNRAENAMIVDLLRNDLSQDCEPFSVSVPAFCELHRFTNVQHLISTINAERRSDRSQWQLFCNSFPGGSITGAPKKSAMSVIAELEPHERGPYCGSLAYFSRHGKMDSNILIRSLLLEANSLHCFGGGGVVIDSDPTSEYAESVFKVTRLMDAISASPHSPS